MIGERKGSKILSCTHAGRVITLVPVAEVFPWHLDPLFIMRQITHGGVSAAWQNQHPHLCSPHSMHRRKTNMTYERPQLLTSKLSSGPRKHNGLHVLRKSENKDGISAPSLKTNRLIFVRFLVTSTNCCALGGITHCLLYDNMHWKRFLFFILKVLCAAFLNINTSLSN